MPLFSVSLAQNLVSSWLRCALIGFWGCSGPELSAWTEEELAARRVRGSCVPSVVWHVLEQAPPFQPSTCSFGASGSQVEWGPVPAGTGLLPLPHIRVLAWVHALKLQEWTGQRCDVPERAQVLWRAWSRGTGTGQWVPVVHCGAWAGQEGSHAALAGSQSPRSEMAQQEMRCNL